MATDDRETRDRLLLAAASLLDEARGRAVSTRAICDRAGVQAPSLYHHFGSKDRLFDAVVTHGFKRFLADRRGAPSEDPLADIRDGWDTHVRFALEHPETYALIYGRIRPGLPCAVVADVEAMILEALRPAARRGRLRVPPAQAAAHVVAASSGVALALIQQPPERRDPSLSDRVRDGVLAAIATDAPAVAEPGAAPAAIALTAALEDRGGAEVLSPGERGLLRELLARVAGRAPHPAASAT